MELEPTALNDEQFQANRFDLVSRLADDLAHEIRNPLNAIVINLEVLKVRVGRGDSDGALAQAALIEQETRRLHHMIDRMMQLLRPDPDAGSSFALDKVFDELIPLVDARVRHARNAFFTDCAGTAFLDVPRDEFKFAVLNLLMAVHLRLGEEGGTLSLACDTDGDDIRILIGADTGDAPLRAADPEYERSLAMAAALLHTCGGRIESHGGGVTVVLPRSRS